MTMATALRRRRGRAAIRLRHKAAMRLRQQTAEVQAQAHHFLPLQGFAHLLGGAAVGGGRVVQFMRQSRRQFAERDHLLLLL